MQHGKEKANTLLVILLRSHGMFVCGDTVGLEAALVYARGCQKRV